VFDILFMLFHEQCCFRRVSRATNEHEKYFTLDRRIQKERERRDSFGSNFRPRRYSILSLLTLMLALFHAEEAARCPYLHTA